MKTKLAAFWVIVLVTLMSCVGPALSAPFGSTPMPFTSATGLASEGGGIQAQVAEMEAERISQIKGALLADFWSQYRIYIQALAAGDSTTNAIYPRWPLSSTPNDPKANFRYLADKYLPDLKNQIKSMSTTTGVPETDFYEIEYVPPSAGEPLPAPGHVILRRLHAEATTQGRIRGLLGSVTVENIGENGVISMRIDPPSAFMGSDALNVSLVRNNGLTLDPILAQELYSSETAGPDVSFLPGTWVTFAKKGTNPGTAQAKGESEATVYRPTLRFKGRDGQIIGLNELDMEQAFGDPATRIIFKQAAANNGNPLDANYIRFEDNLGSIIGLANIYRRNGSDGRSGDDMALAIWAHLAQGGDFTVLSAGDTVNGSTANSTGQIKFGLGNTARIYLAGPGDLRIEGNNAVRVKAPTVTADGNLAVTGNLTVDGTSGLTGAVSMYNGLNMNNTDINNVRNLKVNGTSDLSGAVTMHGGLNMSNTDINNISTVRAANAIISSLTLAGRTGTQSSPYNVWVDNSLKANYADNSGLLNGKTEAQLRVAYADNAGLLNGKSEGNLRVGYADNAGLLGGKSEGNLRVSYAATAGTATSATTANTATTATTASGLTTAVWNQIKAMIPNPDSGTNPGGDGGGGGIKKTGSGWFVFGTGTYAAEVVTRSMRVTFDVPFPNKLDDLKVTYGEVIATLPSFPLGHPPYRVGTSTENGDRYGFTMEVASFRDSSVYSHNLQGNDSGRIYFEYVALGY
jgi:hypothetical protein